MRALLPILIAALIAAPASAGGRRRTAAVSATREEVAIAFVGVTSGSGPDAMIDAGTMSHTRSHHRLGTDRIMHGNVATSASLGALLTFTLSDGVAMAADPLVVQPQKVEVR